MGQRIVARKGARIRVIPEKRARETSGTATYPRAAWTGASTGRIQRPEPAFRKRYRRDPYLFLPIVKLVP